MTNTRSLRMLTVALAAGCALGLAHIVSIIGFHVPLDPNEGWNAYFTQAAMTGHSPYPAPQSLMINNYPPLSFYIVGIAAKLFGDAIIAGRIAALVALVALATGIDTCARAMGATRFEGLFAALFFSAGVMLTSDYAGMNDPQILGHAVAIGGLWLALREPRTPRDMVGAAALFALAFFIKHNLIVLPLATAVWLALLNPRLAVTFTASGAIFGLVGLGIFRQVFGFSLLSMVASPRSYDITSIWDGLESWLTWSAIPLAGAVALFVIARRDRYAMFCAIYAAVATLAGVYFLGGAGVDANALFDADIALALSAALLLNRLPVWREGAALAYAIPLIAGLWLLDAPWETRDFWFRPMADERASADAEIALLKASNGPAICEMLSLCYWAGKPATVDVFNMEQAYVTGARSDAVLVHDIANRRYGVVQLEEPEPFPLTPAVQRALEANYHVVRQDDDRAFYAPNRAP
jgi:dolichyl-phosphate-mannose-protein mannosyltransferase